MGGGARRVSSTCREPDQGRGGSTDSEEEHGLICKKLYLDGGRSYRQQGIIHKIGQPLQDNMPTEDKNTFDCTFRHSQAQRTLGLSVPAFQPLLPAFPLLCPNIPRPWLQHDPAPTPVHSFHPSILPLLPQHLSPESSIPSLSWQCPTPTIRHSPLKFSILFYSLMPAFHPWTPKSSMPTFQPFKPKSSHPFHPAHALGKGSRGRARPFGKLRV